MGIIFAHHYYDSYELNDLNNIDIATIEELPTVSNNNNHRNNMATIYPEIVTTSEVSSGAAAANAATMQNTNNNRRWGGRGRGSSRRRSRHLSSVRIGLEVGDPFVVNPVLLCQNVGGGGGGEGGVGQGAGTVAVASRRRRQCRFCKKEDHTIKQCNDSRITDMIVLLENRLYRSYIMQDGCRYTLSYLATLDDDTIAAIATYYGFSSSVPRGVNFDNISFYYRELYRDKLRVLRQTTQEIHLLKHLRNLYRQSIYMSVAEYLIRRSLYPEEYMDITNMGETEDRFSEFVIEKIYDIAQHGNGVSTIVQNKVIAAVDRAHKVIVKYYFMRNWNIDINVDIDEYPDFTAGGVGGSTDVSDLESPVVVAGGADVVGEGEVAATPPKEYYCAICLSSYSEQMNIKTNCSHEFCIDCFSDYLINNTKRDVSCPYCRTDICDVSFHCPKTFSELCSIFNKKIGFTRLLWRDVNYDSDSSLGMDYRD